MDITLSIDGLVVSMPYPMIIDLALGLDAYSVEQRQALICLAKHNDYEIRAIVAAKENLSPECYHQLADDPSVDVLSELLMSSSFHQYASFDIYQKITMRDPRLLSEISRDISVVEPELLPIVGKWLISLDDYKTRWDLVDSRRTPKFLLAILADDADETIAEMARSRLAPDADSIVNFDDEPWTRDDDHGDRDE
jgi:hypothetical protein